MMTCSFTSFRQACKPVSPCASLPPNNSGNSTQWAVCFVRPAWLDVVLLRLARTVYIYTPFTWWFPCQKHCIYIHLKYIWFWQTILTTPRLQSRATVDIQSEAASRTERERKHKEKYAGNQKPFFIVHKENLPWWYCGFVRFSIAKKTIPWLRTTSSLQKRPKKVGGLRGLRTGGWTGAVFSCFSCKSARCGECADPCLCAVLFHRHGSLPAVESALTRACLLCYSTGTGACPLWRVRWPARDSGCRERRMSNSYPSWTQVQQSASSNPFPPPPHSVLLPGSPSFPVVCFFNFYVVMGSCPKILAVRGLAWLVHVAGSEELTASSRRCIFDHIHCFRLAVLCCPTAVPPLP